MKNFFLLFSILFIIVSCNQSNKKINIHGSISDFNNEQITLSSDEFKQQAVSDSTGHYDITFSAKSHGYYKLELEKKYEIYLEPGWNIKISVDEERKLIFEGEGALENNFFNANIQYRDSILNAINYEALFSSEKSEFIKKMNEYQSKLNKKLKNFQEEQKYSKNFIEFEYRRNLYWWADMMNTYPMMFKTYKGYNNPDIDSNYSVYLNDLDLNDSILLQLYEYKDFVKSYVNLSEYLTLTYSKKFKHNEYKETYARFNAITSTFTNTKVLEYVLKYNVNRQINRLEMNEELMIALEKECKNDSIIHEVRSNYNNLKKLFKGNKAPNFAIPDQSGKIHQLSDFKGKYLYLDIWSTYCTPCIAEFPYFIELEKEFKSKNIQFVGICLDNSEQRWLSILEKKNLVGIQLRSRDGWKSDFPKDYLISSVPCYVLIDKEGNFLNARAPKPSDNIREILLRLDGI